MKKCQYFYSRDSPEDLALRTNSCGPRLESSRFLGISVLQINTNSMSQETDEEHKILLQCHSKIHMNTFQEWTRTAGGKHIDWEWMT